MQLGIPRWICLERTTVPLFPTRSTGWIISWSANYSTRIELIPETHDILRLQWEIVPLGAGYAIRSIRKGAYVTVDNALEEGSFVIVTDFPVAWDIEVSRVVADRKDDEGVTVRSVNMTVIVGYPSQIQSCCGALVSSGRVAS